MTGGDYMTFSLDYNTDFVMRSVIKFALRRYAKDDVKITIKEHGNRLNVILVGPKYEVLTILEKHERSWLLRTFGFFKRMLKNIMHYLRGYGFK